MLSPDGFLCALHSALDTHHHRFPASVHHLGSSLPEQTEHFFFTAEDNTVINLFLIDECRNGATTTNGIQCVQMIVVSWWDGLLCIDILTKCCMEQAASRSCVASAFPARSACTYPLVTSFSNAFREEASKAHAGPMTHTIRPCCFSYFNEECAKESC